MEKEERVSGKMGQFICYLLLRLCKKMVRNYLKVFMEIYDVGVGGYGFEQLQIGVGF